MMITREQLAVFITSADLMQEFEDTVWLQVDREEYETITELLENETENNLPS